jgi:hypothetical protein
MEVTTTTAPWWYVAALAGAFTILGGVITLTGGYFSDRRKLRREDDRRWDDNLRMAASEYVESIASYIAAGAAYKNAVNADALPAGIDRTGSQVDPAVQLSSSTLEDRRKAAKREAGYREPLDQAEAKAEGCLIALRIVAPDDVGGVAREILRISRQSAKLTGPERKEARDRLRQLLDDLSKAVSSAQRVKC